MTIKICKECGERIEYNYLVVGDMIDKTIICFSKDNKKEALGDVTRLKNQHDCIMISIHFVKKFEEPQQKNKMISWTRRGNSKNWIVHFKKSKQIFW